MDVQEVLRFLPHRYPFMLIDRVLEFEANQRLLALKNVTYNEHFFTGHFPVKPVMPGVLIVEAMAQATGLLAGASNPEAVTDTSVYMFVGIDKARFRKPVGPGDQLHIEVIQTNMRRGIGSYECSAKVDGEVVSTATIMCAAKDLSE